MILVYLGLVAGALALFTLAMSKQIEARFPPVGDLVNVGPGAIHVVETAPEGPERGAVLLVHGASGNFADLHVALTGRLTALGFRVFSVDRPGHGSTKRFHAGHVGIAHPVGAFGGATQRRG